MELVKQINPFTCGQAYLAMITGRDITEVIKELKTDGPIGIGIIMDYLDKCQIKHASKNIRISKKNPMYTNYSLLTVHFETYTHWTLNYEGVFYDPEFGLLKKYQENGRITSFLSIEK